MMNIKFKKLAFIVSSIALTAVTQTSAMACDPAAPGCSTTTTSKTDIVINLQGNGLDSLNNSIGGGAIGVLVPVNQISTGHINATATASSPVANTLAVTATAIANAVTLDVDRKLVAVATQSNSGNVTATSWVVDVGGAGMVKESIDITATAIGNVFNANVNLAKDGSVNNLAAAIAQCNTGNISAVSQYSRVDPDSLKVSATAIGNVATITNTGVVKVSVR